MASIAGFLKRFWTATHPPEPPKSPDAIRIGLFGASWIAPSAIILPARSHADVIIAAIAARDLKKAKAYAKKHNIPNVHSSYQDLLDDPTIDCVYIPLPNGLHYEWALRALRKGKHVLLEKPSVSNAQEAISLFRHPSSLPTPHPIILEAYHYKFHPAFQLFLSQLEPENIESAHANLSGPAYFFPKDDIRFKYDLSGGALMDMGCYCISILRSVFGTEPVDCVSSTPRLMPLPYDQKCDQAIEASWQFPNGGIGSIDADLAKTKFGGLPWIETPAVVVKHKEIAILKPVEGVKLGDGQTHHVQRTATFWNFIAPSIWHRIDVVDSNIIKDTDEKVVKTWTVKSSKKAYDFGPGDPVSSHTKGEPHWSTYRYQLEAFVDMIKGRTPPSSVDGAIPSVWVSGEDSIHQMEIIDQAYTKARLPLRPSCEMLNIQAGER